MAKLRDIEAVLEQNAKNWLMAMELHGYQSHQVSIYRVVKDVHTDVYGREAGEEGKNKVAEIDCLLVGDDFFPSDSYAAGTFQEGWMYTTSDKVQVGDRVELLRPASDATRRYQVVALHRMGTSRAVFKKYKLSAIGD